MYAVSADLMKEIDRCTIEEIGIPSMVLMENAARCVVKHIINKVSYIDECSLLVVCGKGNNGGDGVCVARILHEMGYDVTVYMVASDSTNYTNDEQKQLNIARNCGVRFIETMDLTSYDVIVDAIFGIGLTREIKGEYYDVIKTINDYKEYDKKNLKDEESLRYNNGDYISRIASTKKLVFAIDIPSGINATTAEVMGIAIKADYTITFGVNKIGMILHPGRMYTGEIIVEDIGFSKKVIETICNKDAYNIYNEETFRELLPQRMSYSNKGSYGKVLVIAGKKNMAGAALMCARASYKMGAGLVKVYTIEENRTIIQETVPEAVLLTYNEFNNEEKVVLERAIDDASAIVIGPGLGTDEKANSILMHTISYVQNKHESSIPMVIDADAINILSTKEDVVLKNVIFTPHLKELSRLTKKSVDFIQNNIYNPICLRNEVKCLDKGNENSVLVIKDAVTMTLNNEMIYMNTSGNNGLATGGSGDVLSGIIVGLVATGADNIKAASLGAFIHGLCADEYVKDFNPYSLNATDIINYIEKVIGGISNEEVL